MKLSQRNILAAAAAAAAGLGGTAWLYFQGATQKWVNSNGQYVDSVSYAVGADMKLSTQVPLAVFTPETIQHTIDGPIGTSVGATETWDISKTGGNYVWDAGPAPNDPGAYTVTVKIVGKILGIFPMTITSVAGKVTIQ